MKIVFLGTSAALPTEKRGLSCICVERNGEILMFDAGEAAQIAFLKSGLGWNKKMRIFVTHLHGDHCIGILGLLQTLNMRDRTKPLEIYGPSGIEEFIMGNIKTLGFDPRFPILINIVGEGQVCESKEYTVCARKACHTVTAFSYLIAERDRPGRFNREMAVKLGIPEGRLWKQLQEGNSIVVDGRHIKPDKILGQKRPGRKIGVSGDTMPTTSLEEFFDGCDYLVFDSTFLEEERDRARETGHSTARQAAVLGKNAGVKNLILTHFSARYDDEARHSEEAEQVHGSVTCARDMLVVEVP